MMTMGGGLWIGLLVLLLLLLLIGGLVALVVWIISQQSGKTSTEIMTERPSQEDALDILRRRYAQGEISREEYQVMREDLIS